MLANEGFFTVQTGAFRGYNDRHVDDPVERSVAIYYSFDLRLGVASDD